MGIALKSGSISPLPTTSVLPSSFLISHQLNPKFDKMHYAFSSSHLSVAEDKVMSIEDRVLRTPISSAAITYSSTTVRSGNFPASLEARSFPIGNSSPGKVTLESFLAVDSCGDTLAFTPTASSAGTISASTPIALINAKTVAEHLTQVLNVTIERKHNNLTIPKPTLTVTKGQHVTEVAAAFPTTSGIILFEYVYRFPILTITVSSN